MQVKQFALSNKFCPKDIMESAWLLLLLVVTTTQAAYAKDGICNTCNCQFNNVQVLDQLIRRIVADSTLSSASGGATYIRWGRSSCPDIPGTELVYAGRAGGNFWNIQGGGTEKLCLPGDPDYLVGTTGLNTAIPNSPHVYGAEYEYLSGPNSNVNQHNVPCAVCHTSNRSSSLMIPAKSQCPSTWIREYYGYLSTERGASNHHRSSFNCVDHDPEAIGGTRGNTNGALFYYVLTSCNGLECPPYESERALSCVVCTK